MRFSAKLFLLASVAISLAIATGNAQDSPPSLGDVARQTRQQKQQTTQNKDAKPTKIITNEEIPERPTPLRSVSSNHDDRSRTSTPSGEGKISAERWKSQILAQKSQIATLQRQVDDLNESIRFAPANCVANCVGWNERQREKQQQVERMRTQLDEEKRRLDDMQDMARKQGYGSSVYDP
jgi:hypothetical protein